MSIKENKGYRVLKVQATKIFRIRTHEEIPPPETGGEEIKRCIIVDPCKAKGKGMEGELAICLSKIS